MKEKNTYIINKPITVTYQPNTEIRNEIGIISCLKELFTYIRSYETVC